MLSVVLRHSGSFFALLAFIAAPVVTTTRSFCRYSGQEIVGCSVTATPCQAQLREDTCCQQKTFYALDRVRLADEQQRHGSPPFAFDAVPVPVARVMVIAATVVRGAIARSAGPPAFISHRALLI